MAFSSYVLAFGQDEAGEVYTLVADSTGPAGAQGKVFKISAP